MPVFWGAMVSLLLWFGGLQIKKGTVMSRLFHARRGLAQRLRATKDEVPEAMPEGAG